MPSNNTPPSLPAKAVGKAGVLYGLDSGNDNIVNAIRVDASGALITVGSTGAVPPSAQTSVVTSYYIAINDGVGYSVDDILRLTEVVNVSTGVAQTSGWYNTTTNLPIADPLPADVSFKPSDALTDEELRAAPVDVNVVNTTERQFISSRIAAAAGSVTAGALEVSIAVESGYATIQGTYMPAGYSMTIRAEMQDTVGAITIDATNGSVIVMEVR